jgi:hypothetical protein
MNAAQAFKELVIGNSSRGKGANALMNVTFFMGAGFSKTWDTKSPTGNELFTFPKEFIESLAAEIEIDELLTQPGYPTLDDTAPSKFKELLYNLSMQLKYPGIRTRYMDENSLNYVISEIKALVQQRFEAVTTLNHYAVDQNKFLLPPKLTNDQSDILRFFQWLSEQQRQDRGVAHGVHTDFLSTNYDYVLETILDNTGEGNALPRWFAGKRTPTSCRISGRSTR